MNRWVKDSPRVLDFGCGIGDYGLSYAIENKTSKVDFYDINKENLDYLKHRIMLREVQKLVEVGQCKVYREGGLGEPEEFYDQIFVLDVLEHIKNPVEAAARIRKMLKRNGTLIAQVSPKEVFQPQHIGEIDLNQHGFLQTDIYTYVRSDSDMAINYAKNVQVVKDNMFVGPIKSDKQEVQKVDL
jgi:cyclopropane fatty-acyl-phospholipid synthase-like methyltransferase